MIGQFPAAVDQSEAVNLDRIDPVCLVGNNLTCEWRESLEVITYIKSFLSTWVGLDNLQLIKPIARHSIINIDLYLEG